MYEGRWVIQLVVLASWIAVLIVSRTVYRRKFEWRYCLRNLTPWFAHIVVFNVVALIHHIVFGTNAPLSAGFVWWASVIRLHGAIAFIGTFRYILKNGY